MSTKIKRLRNFSLVPGSLYLVGFFVSLFTEELPTIILFGTTGIAFLVIWFFLGQAMTMDGRSS